MASSCNGCFGGLVFPDFVQQRCCNPCCKQTTGSVGGTSTTNPTCTCTCTCTQQSGTRYFHFDIQFRLRMQPLLRLSRYAAGRSTIRWGGPFSLLYK